METIATGIGILVGTAIGIVILTLLGFIFKALWNSTLPVGANFKVLHSSRSAFVTINDWRR